MTSQIPPVNSTPTGNHTNRSQVTHNKGNPVTESSSQATKFMYLTERLDGKFDFSTKTGLQGFLENFLGLLQKKTQGDLGWRELVAGMTDTFNVGKLAGFLKDIGGHVLVRARA